MRQFIICIIFGCFLISCEEVIDVDLNDADPRLVIEANIDVRLETGDVFNSVKLTTTAPFFDNQIPVVEDALVQITDENGLIFPYTYLENGIYTADFVPQPNTRYTLEVVYKNEVFKATTTLVTSVPLEYIEQKNDGGFTGDQIEIKTFFRDPPGENNFYYFTGSSIRGVSRDVLSDEFFDGNLIFGLYRVDDLEVGDDLQLRLYGVSEEFYNYMFILLQQTGNGSGPFETQPATVKGNIINETNPENYPLGYFRISELSVLNYEVQ